jgi:hypothetical protein
MAYPTKVTVVKFGPYFSSGSISFSQLRTNFAERGSGEIRASNLRRNTNLVESNPIVPDSTENEQISTGSNLSLSQFRNSIKKYFAYQTGTDSNSSFATEPGFRMGRLDLNNRGIDWSGGGYNGRDGQGGGTSGNLTKNVQKTVYITGTCGSVRFGFPAAQLSPVVQVFNVTIDVSGSILGYGGLGGYDPRGYPYGNQSGENGGIALNLGNVGDNNLVYVQSSARIYGGGGGGEQGRNGDRGSVGTCWREYGVSSCGGSPSCSSGGFLVSSGSGGCCSYSSSTDTKGKVTTTCVASTVFGTCRIEQTSSPPIQGIGGRGGNGQGYNQSRTDGQDGSAGTCPTCPPGLNLSGGQCATNGGRGGYGGDWGSDGEETPGQRSRGFAGAAINRDNFDKTYKLDGTNNSNTIRGAVNL